MSLGESFMKLLGAKAGSTSKQRYDWQTDEQKDLWGDVLSGYKDLKYQGPGGFAEGKKADELEGFKATSFDQLQKLKNEGRLSLEGLEKLRNYGATAATQVNPDIEALRGLGDKAWTGYDAHLSEITRGARRRLEAGDVAARRGTGTGGTALTRAIGQNIGDYGKVVGEASARVAEESAYKRQQLAMQGRMQAGQLGLGATQQGLQGLNIAQSGELGQLQMTAQDLAQRRGIHSQERQYQGQNELQRARYSAERADARNLWNQQGAQDRNRFALDRLSGAGKAATTRTFEDVVTKTKGSAGLGGTVLTVGGAVLGGWASGGNPAAIQAGAAAGGSLARQWGPEDSGAGSDAMSQAAYQGASSYGAWGGGGTTGGTGGTYNPSSVPPSMRGMGSRPIASGEYNWWQDDPNSGWWDEMGRSNQQLGMDRQEDLYAQQRWDRRYANRQNFLGHQTQLHANYMNPSFNINPY